MLSKWLRSFCDPRILSMGTSRGRRALRGCDDVDANGEKQNWGSTKIWAVQKIFLNVMAVSNLQA
jgi:hypothetical protein